MRTEQEMQKRLEEAVEGRRALLEEEMQSAQATDAKAASELTEEIAHLSGVIVTLEWVLETGAGVEYES